MTKTVGVVLAGGLSRRFGSPKAFAQVDGRKFYEIAIAALDVHCDEVVVVTRPELMAGFPAGVNVLIDVEEFSGLGPLAGILSAMEFVEADRYAVLPCDMPHVDSNVMGKLLGYHQKGVTAVVSEGQFHPLISVWGQELKSMLRNALLNDQLRVMKVVPPDDMTWIDGSLLTEDEKRIFMNVNTPGLVERN